MFRIRDFSKFTRVSVKMLRHYDEVGLLKPARVEPATGYRFYSTDQLPRLNRIIALKDLGFTLEQIARLLNDRMPSDAIKGMLQLRRAEIEQQLVAEQMRLRQVEARLRQMDQEVRAPYDVVLRAVAPQLVASLRRIVPSLGAPITRMFDEVERYVAGHGARAASSPLAIFHDAEYQEEDLDIEVVVPLKRQIPGGEHVTIRELPGMEMMACVVYTGSYERTPEALNALLIWIEANRYAVAGPIREVYLRFGADDAERLNLPPAFLAEEQQLYVTEVQVPVQM